MGVSKFAGWSLTEFLREAEQDTEPADPAQGLVLVITEGGGHVYGYIRNVTNWALSLEQVTGYQQGTGAAGIVAVVEDYPLHISVRHIMMARYADLTNLPRKAF